MNIIKAEPKHAIQVSNLIKILDTDNFHFSKIEKVNNYIENGYYYIVLDKNNIINGAISLIDQHHCMFINTLVSKKQGCGRKLINFAIEKCRKEKIPKIYCWSLIRYNAIGFYEKMGFEERFLLKQQWYGEDCYFFGKIIKNN